MRKSYISKQTSFSPVQENQQTPQPQSHFVWQPILLLAVVLYLLAEVYFLTAMVNTLDAGIRSSDFTFMEHLGRFISGAGIGLSVVIGLSMNHRLYQFPKGQRIIINTAIFSICTFVGYFAVKSLYEVIEANTSKPIVHCSVLGNAAIRAFDGGTLPGYEHYVQADGTQPYPQQKNFSRQLVRLYLPLHVCLDDNYRRQLQASEVIRDELTLMVKETKLPIQLARPAVEMYEGFREQLPRFAEEVAHLDGLSAESEIFFTHRETLMEKLRTQLTSQSRFTQTDVDRIVSIYACGLDTAIERGEGSPYEQRFMLAVTDCLYDRARGRFKTLPGVQKGIDVYQLEQGIALDWARQFILSPHHMPEKALDLMRQSFALVFLPTYAVFISTFVVFMCLAAYFRTRFLIQAAKRQKRVNPVINAMLSPLVVVPGIWTLIFVWVPEPDIEKELFPSHTHSNWVKVTKVTIRPLMHYYSYSHVGFTQLRVPLFIAPRESEAQKRLLQRRERQRNQVLETLKGYYIGEICRESCESIILDLKDGNVEFANIRYPNRDCDNRLIFDTNNKTNITFYESSKNALECPSKGVWTLNVEDQGLEIEVKDKELSGRASLTNLFI